MTYDVVIRGGTLVDGTGAAPRTADIGITGDRVVDVGRVDSVGSARLIGADGCLVTPGFVDLHSHLDAQIGWDPLMSSSCYHGVTSVVMGNCGMTFAPVRPGGGAVLAHIMESVEDIPASCILAGLDWKWETYAEYLDTIDAMPKGINAGGYVGDVALRNYVIGDGACDPEYAATDDELAAMAAQVEIAMQAGALGYSISRSLTHRVPDGRWVPGTWSAPEEFMTIAAPLGRLGRGVVECAPRYNTPDGGERVAEEMAWIAELSRRIGRPFTFNLMQIRSLGTHYRDVLAIAERENALGAQLRPQTTPRSIGVLFSLDANTLIDDLPSFQALKPLAGAERLRAIRDPDVRAKLVEEGATKSEAFFGQIFLMTPDAGARYAYAPDDSIAARARARGVSSVAHYLDELDRTDGRAVANWPVMNENFAAIAEILRSSVAIMGLADAGAHATQIMDASQPTFFLAHWIRDQQAMSVEEGVRRITSDTADFVGYTDRGRLQPGSFADVNVVDLQALTLALPEIVHDFPGGAPRFVQKASGIEHTLVNGVALMERGEPTGALPGRLLRSTD